MSEDSKQPERTPRKRRRKRFVVLLIALLGCVTLISAEVVVRVYVRLRGWTPNCYAGSVDLFHPHPKTGYLLRPGFRLKSGTWEISVNESGFRGPEIAASRKPGTTRVAVLGGSSVFGYLVSDGQEAARLLEEELNADAGTENQFEVINGGVPGHNLYQTRWRFENQIARFEPELVILYLGWNDLGYIVSDQPDAESFRKRPVASSYSRLASRSTFYGLVVYRLVGGSASLSAESLSSTEPSRAGAAQFRSNLTGLVRAATESGSQVVVCAQVTAAHPDSDKALHGFLGETVTKQKGMIELGNWQRKTLQEVAVTAGVPFFDLNERIQPSVANLRDYVHLSEGGEEQLAMELAEIIRREFSRKNSD